MPIADCRTSQSGALFGLDARIALAVFASLTIIIGYVSFGRIGLARQAAAMAEIEAIENALANYQADMGTFYLFTLKKTETDTDSTEDLAALWNTDLILPGFTDNWNGPYLGRETRKQANFGHFSIFYAQEEHQTHCTVESRCFIWLALTEVPSRNWAEINSYYDEGHGKYPEKGGQNIAIGRVRADASTATRTLYFRTRVERPRP